MTPKQARLTVALILFTCIIWALFLWVKNHGFIQISTTGNGKDTISYIIKNEDTGKSITVSSDEKSFKRFVKKGNYTIVASQANRKAVLLIQSEGYLKTVEKSQGLHAENYRSFVGANPNTCMDFIDLLYSYDCNSAFDTLKKHIPGSQSGPTYTQNAEANTTSNIIAVREFNGAPYIITQDTTTSEAEGYTPTYSKLEGDLSIQESSPLKNVPAAQSYSITNLNGGLLLYNGNLKKAYSFTDITTSPKAINLDSPEEDNLEPVQLSVYGDAIGTYFSEPYLGSEIVGKNDNNEMVKGKSEFIVRNKDSKSQHYSFNTLYESALLCGKNRICLTAKQRLHIYDVSSSKPKLLYIMSEVKEVDILGDSLIINTNYGTLKLSPGLTGYPVYTLGEYTYCGSRIQNTQIIVCVADKSNRKNALLIDITRDDTDSIDKKIIKVSQLDSVKTLSIYQNYIYIVQNAGEREYIAEKKGFFYPQSKIDAATNKIKQEISASGIDKLPYSIQFNY